MQWVWEQGRCFGGRREMGACGTWVQHGSMGVVHSCGSVPTNMPNSGELGESRVLLMAYLQCARTPSIPRVSGLDEWTAARQSQGQGGSG